MSKKLHGISWLAQALCKDADPKLFLSLDREDIEEAKHYCKTCPVKMECYYAYFDINCVAGGTTLLERLLRNWERDDGKGS